MASTSVADESNEVNRPWSPIFSYGETTDFESTLPDFAYATTDSNIVQLIDSLRREPQGTIPSSIFALVSTMLGGGVLSVPFAVSQGGLVGALIILVISVVTSCHGAFLMVNCKKYCQGKVQNLEDVARSAFNKKGEVVCQVVLIAVLFLSAVAYFLLFYAQMLPVMKYFAGEGSDWTQRVVVLALSLPVVIPLSLLKSLTALKYTSALSISCVVFLALSVMSRSIQSGFGGKGELKLFPTRFHDFVNSLSIMELAFTCHFNVLPMHDELLHQTRTAKRIILILAMLLAFSVNIIIGVFGYLQFHAETLDVITKNYPINDHLILAGRILLSLVLILNLPLIVFPMRASLNNMVWTPERVAQWKYALMPGIIHRISNRAATGPSLLFWVLETALLLASCFLVAYFVQDIKIVWGFIGSIGCTMIVFILPAAFYLRLRIHPERPDAHQLGAMLLLVVGVGVLAAGIYSSVVNIMESGP